MRECRAPLLRKCQCQVALTASPSYLHSTRRRAQKGNFFGAAAKEGIAILFPDTSPRGAGIEGETDSWDFGVGAFLLLPWIPGRNTR